MRTARLIGVLIGVTALAVAMQAAQSGAVGDQAQKPAAKPSKTVTLVGCVGGTGAAGDPFTLLNTKEGLAYRLTGTNMRAYKGQRVQIAGGTDSGRLKIVGGLMPSPNVAAQAGAIDPARSAVASDPLSIAGKSDQLLPEFRVRSVRTLGGACEQ